MTLRMSHPRFIQGHRIKNGGDRSLHHSIKSDWLEVDLQRKLPETTLVVRTIEVADATLGRCDRHRHAVANVSDVIQPILDKEVVMVQQIESLCAELHVDLFMDRKDLTDSRIKG